MRERILQITKTYFDFMEKHPKADKWVFGLSLAIAANVASYYLTKDPTEKTIDRFEREINRLNAERVNHLNLIERLIEVKDEKNQIISDRRVDYERCAMSLSGRISDIKNSWCFRRIHTQLDINVSKELEKNR